MTTKIGVIGTGNISGIYLENITTRFKELEIVGICDLIEEKVKSQGEKYGISHIYPKDYDLLSDPQIELVLNLTEPNNHFPVMKKILEAGKHGYVEKPLSTSFAQGKELVELAKSKGLRIGGAPDTFLGGGIQTCRKLIEDGYIGTVIGADAIMSGRGHESWHPGPEFYYKLGGGPMFDMGPYYITALINLIGGVSEVCGMTNMSFPTRRITSEPLFGTEISVEVQTHVNAMLRFNNGAIGTITTSFDLYENNSSITIYGSEGTLYVPDPNGFDGPIKLVRKGQEPMEFPTTFAYTSNSRALGLADMAKAIETGRDHRANERQQLHVLEIMEKIHTSNNNKAYCAMETKFTASAPMKDTDIEGILD